MRALVIYCHPRADSFTAAVRDRVLTQLAASGAETRCVDLYGSGFDPIMQADEHRAYEDEAVNQRPIEAQVEDLKWCTALIFVYPTWWYGLPAMLKGWLDRAFVPGMAFYMPDAEHKNIRPGLPHITHLAAFTTCGASRWLTFLVGAPGRKTLLRGVRLLCAKRCRTLFCAHYSIDGSTAQSRAAHLDTVAAKVAGFVPPAPPMQTVQP